LLILHPPNDERDEEIKAHDLSLSTERPERESSK
jgi:hypothetical protein